MKTVHSQSFPAAFAAVLLAMWLISASGVADAAAQSGSLETASPQGEQEKRITALIGQLASPDFETRQRATHELWQMGTPSLERLQSEFLNGTNSESRMRARDLWTLIKVGVAPDAEAKVVQCVTGFLDREILVQSRAIEKLCHLQHRSVAQKLVELVESESDRGTLLEFCSPATSEAEAALRLGDEAKFQQWINDPATRKSRKLLFYYHLWVEDKLDAEIEKLKQAARVEIKNAQEYGNKKKSPEAEDSRPENGDQSKEIPDDAAKQPQLKTLIGLLRFVERWDEALEFSKLVHNRSDRRMLTHSILMESGNWKRLAQLIVEADPDNDKDEKLKDHDGLAFAASGYRKALVQLFAGNEEAFAATVGDIEADIAEEIRKKKLRGVREPESNSQHAEFLRYALDFDRSIKFTPLKRNRATFRLLGNHRRYEMLFDVFGLQTGQKRARFFKSRARHIRSLVKRVQYHQQQNESGELDEYTEKRDAEVEAWRDIAGLLASLGLLEEAELYYRQLYFDFSDAIPEIPSRIIGDLARIDAYQSAWEIAGIEYQRSGKVDFRNALLGNRGYENFVINLLDRGLRKSIEDPLERFRKIAAITKSPSDLSGQSVDFWKEIDKVDFSSQSMGTNHSQALRSLFLIWNVAEARLLETTADPEGAELPNELLQSGDYLAAAQKFEALAFNEGQPVHYASAWHAYDRAGEASRAKQMRLLFALKFDPDDAYDYTSGFNGTSWQSLPFDAFRLYDALENVDAGVNCYYLWRIADGDSKAVLSAHQKMVRTQILRLRYIDSPYFEDSQDDHPLFIHGCLESGDTESARRWFRKLARFQPADSSFVENRFPLLQKQGGDALIDEMFEDVSAGFYKILSRFPDSAMFLNNYAWACACAKRNVTNGIALAKRAVERQPGAAGYLDTLAELYHVNGQAEDAIRTIRRAIEINPERPYYRQQLTKFRAATNR